MAEKQAPRVLMVDDEPAIRETLPPILEQHGFEVTTASSVPDALDAINKQGFDILLADLNIGQPGDGFTVVSAMRRTQPDAVTIIITGFPAFETALEAIRDQVDDYVVKPADIPTLLRVIHRHLSGPRRRAVMPRRRVCTVLREHRDEILAEWLAAVKADPELGAIAIPDDERADHMPQLLEGIIESLEAHTGVVSHRAIEAARQHGRVRRAQGYTMAQVLTEARHLRRILSGKVQQHLLTVDISNLLSDLIYAGDNLDASIRASVEGFAGEAAA